MQTGKINVQTENIFPIIKKFLYSDHEIFLRELISNAVDATQKLKTLASTGHFKDELGDLTIQVSLDKKKGTLTIKDRGIGMTSEEVDKYINQIAFSSAEEFVKKFKTKTEAEQNAIIGHFGLGFYSSFMVSDKVELVTKTYKKGGYTKAAKWSCDGSPDYTLEEADKTDRGTEVTLYITKEEKEFLDEYKIRDLLKKYCRFLPVPIQFGTRKERVKVEGEKDKDGNDKYTDVEKPDIINNVDPLWKKAPVDLKDDDYKQFYRELYPMNFEEPLFHIHLNVDYPFNLTGVLYFPKVKRNFEVQRDKIQLYVNQVFVTESVEGIVPDFLTLLHGVLDSPDIPLNVSRSYLQSDRRVKQISNHIMKKVSDKLDDIFKNQREEYDKKWDDIKVFIQYGMITEEKFYERAQKICLFKNVEGQYFTFDDYKNKIKDNQTDKDKKLVYLYTTNKEEQHGYIEVAKNRGYDVLLMDGVLDNHFINNIEHKFENSTFVRVDADTIEKLIRKSDDSPLSKLDDGQKEAIKPNFEKAVDKEKFNVTFDNLDENDPPVLITQSEFMRRMKDMSALGGGMGMGSLPDMFTLVVNSNHNLIYRMAMDENQENWEKLAKQLTDLALLSQNLLKGEELTKFIKRSVEIL